MNVLNRMKYSLKLGLMTFVGTLGLAVFALLSYATLRTVSINSPMYQNIALGYQLAGDAYDPPASLVAALPAAIAAEDAATPEETRKAVDLLRQDHQAFEQTQKHYQEVLPPGAIRDLMRDASYPAGQQWFQIAEQQYIPALLAGDHEGARKIRIEKMDPLFVEHKAANDKLSELTADWIPTQEKRAAAIVHIRSLELGAVFAAIALVMWLFGWSISRGIVRPVRNAVDVLSAMAEGDLSHSLEVDTADEMHEIADALNRTLESLRTLLSAVSTAAATTSAASAELIATAQDTAQRSREHALATQQSASTAAEMSAAIAEVSGAASNAARSGTATETAAADGHHVVEATMHVIERASETTSEAARQIESLGNRSEQIGRIVGVIEEIAEQTNLLALNAAIEAARAGEQGRGFAVVAGEVRRLAERTTAATKEISSMISTIQQETASAVQVMESGREQVETSLAKVRECDSSLNRIVELARESGAMIQQIASATAEQSAAVDQLTESVSSISRFTEQSATAGEQTLNACSELSKLASDLELRVQKFGVGDLIGAKTPGKEHLVTKAHLRRAA